MKALDRLGARGAPVAALILLSAPAVAAPASFDDLGFIGGPGTFVFDTIGSFNVSVNAGADTELAIWDSAGTLLAQDDDGVSGSLASQITITLQPGVYFLGVNEFDSIFEAGFVNSGSGVEDGEELSIVLNIDGLEAATAPLFGQSGVNATEETLFYRAEVAAAVVPLPASLPLLLAGIAGFGALRAWRRA
ncbi:MAG: DVUA0089 family protein [Paracoccaceae bacterium]|jgi:hypothetical protein|nr:DVUA0089 family protein [Paracoccaceae bacterium]